MTSLMRVTPVRMMVYLSLLVAGSLACKAQGADDAGINDEYAVYAAALTDFGGIGSCVVIANTSIHGRVEDLDNVLSFPIDDARYLSNDLITDFKSKNRHSHILAGHFPNNVNVTLLSESEHDRLFRGSIEGGWDAFYRKYPGANGITRLSRAGFNRQRDTALVYVSNVRNAEVGSGAYLMLAKKDDRWKVISKTRGWIT